MSRIYRIWQDSNSDYDTYDSAVVVANTAEEAKRIHPRNKGMVTPEGFGEKDSDYGAWTCVGNVNVELIGVARPGIPAGTIIVASFNAG